MWTFLGDRHSSGASLIVQLIKNPPAMRETWGLGDPLEKGKATHSNILAWRILWTKSWTQLRDFHFSFSLSEDLI